jgi:hypothetical protein
MGAPPNYGVWPGLDNALETCRRRICRAAPLLRRSLRRSARLTEGRHLKRPALRGQSAAFPRQAHCHRLGLAKCNSTVRTPVTMDAYRQLARLQIPILDGWRHWGSLMASAPSTLPVGGAFSCAGGARAETMRNKGALGCEAVTRIVARARAVTGATVPSLEINGQSSILSLPQP